MSLDLYLYAPIDVGNPEVTSVDVWSSDNVTHNLTPMWREAGCYEALYRSDGATAESVVDCLDRALADMTARPAVFRSLNPENGWGSYEGAIRFLRSTIVGFNRYPKALIRVSS